MTIHHQGTNPDRSISRQMFDEAMRVYLGGNPRAAAIQIGRNDERLSAKYGTNAAAIKPYLEAVLRAVEERTGGGFADDGHTRGSWVAKEFPELSPATCEKIAAYIQYQFQH